MREFAAAVLFLTLLGISNCCWYDVGFSNGRCETLRLIKSILEQRIREMEDEHEQA